MSNVVVAKAKLKNIHIAPRKVRLVTDVIRGMHTTSALAQLQVMPNRSADPIAKLIKSAIANAKDNDVDTADLVIGTIKVDKGITLKRSRARARGRATIIEKKMSHIELELISEEKKAPGFTIPEKTIKVKKDGHAEKKDTPKLKEEVLDPKVKERKGITKRVFQRKSV